MPRVSRAAEFFVVGEPVESARACYVVRAADAELETAVAAGHACLVLGPPGSGKTSMLRRAAARLGASGALVMTFAPPVNEQAVGGGSTDSLARVFAEQMVAALGLAVDAGTWWEAQPPRLGESPFVEFMAEVVLARTTAPVVVLVDDLDVLLATADGEAWLEALQGCYARRERDARFARFTCVLAGSVSGTRLGGSRHLPGWSVALIEAGDFSSQEAYRLAAAFGGDPVHAQALMDRIYVWTAGHPYLTQKVARGVANKGGRLEDVERVVHEQLLAPDQLASDVLLARLASELGRRARPIRRAVRVLRRLASGRRVSPPAEVAVADVLWLSGAARSEEGVPRLRNRVIKELIVARWLAPARRARRVALAAMVLVGVLAAGGYWYTRQLPEADIATLSAPRAELAAIDAAYERLRALPGFAARADELWSGALERQSRAAATLAAATAADARLRRLSNQDARADALLGEFWLRRVRDAMHAEQRDAALLYAQRAARLLPADTRARASFAELVSDDYPLLERSVRLPAVAASASVVFAAETLVSFDGEGRLTSMPLDGRGRSRGAPVELGALELAPLTRELEVGDDGTAGEFTLTLTVQHPDTAELLVRLAAPSGAAADFTLPRSTTDANETFTFKADAGTPLADLADEGRKGRWRLTVIDRNAGNAGGLVGWGLTFGSNETREEPIEVARIPEPTRITDVNRVTAGQRAVVWPRAPGAGGSAAVWNLVTGELERELILASAPLTVALNSAGTRVLTATRRVLTLWDSFTGVEATRVTTQTEFVVPPVFSTDGDYFAIVERVDGDAPLVSVLRSADAALIASVEGPMDAPSIELGPGARYFAARLAANALDLVDARNGAVVRRVQSAAPLERILHGGAGETLVTVDSRGAVVAWPVTASSTPPLELGRTASVASVSRSENGERVAFTRADGASAVVDASSGREVAVVRGPRSDPITMTELAPDGARLVTRNANGLRLWRLPERRNVEAVAEAATAVGLDPAGEVVALGLGSGQVRFGSTASADLEPALAWFGHRGPVTAASVLAARNLAATGGRDGFVRLWDVATGEPTGVVLQSAVTPITAVVLGAGGHYVASAAARLLRIADTDGVVRAEVTLGGAVTALSLSRDEQVFAIADDAGGVVLGAPERSDSRIALTLGTVATALAFTPDGQRLAIGDAAGDVRFVAVVNGATAGQVLRLPQPVRWLAVSDGGLLLAATDSWLHSFALEPRILPIASRFVAMPATSAQFAANEGNVVRVAGLDHGGAFVAITSVLDSPSGERSETASLLEHDWSAVLGVQLNDNGEAVSMPP